MMQVRGSTAVAGGKTALKHCASLYALNAIPPRPSRRAVKKKPVLESGSASCCSHVQLRSLCSVKDAVPDTMPWPHWALVKDTVAVMADPKGLVAVLEGVIVLVIEGVPVLVLEGTHAEAPCGAPGHGRQSATKTFPVPALNVPTGQGYLHPSPLGIVPCVPGHTYPAGQFKALME